ncbi:MAG: TolC family protein [Candidatus Hydrogenedentes bacterium]|nr:TolC family protein [Candidatus Hydrogenedentota bacterium]
MKYRLLVLALTLALVSRAQETVPTQPSPEPTPESIPSPPPPEPATEAAPALQPALETLNLEQAQAIAIKDNPSLLAAAARVEQAQARVKQARSTWFPSVIALSSASNTWISETDYSFAKRAASNGFWVSFALGTQARLQSETLAFAQITGDRIAQFFNPVIQQVQPRPTVPNTDRAIVRDLFETSLRSIDARNAIDERLERYTISIVADWIVFNGFDRKFSNAEARFGRLQTEASFLEAHRILLDAVAQAYYAAQLARENIAIAEADEAFNLRLLSEAKTKRRVGTGSLSDELNFEVRVNAARAALITAKESFNTSLIALAELLALEESRWPDTLALAPLLEETLNDLGELDPEPLVALAKARRPDLEASQYNTDRADAIVGRARSPFYPQVNVQASKDALRDNNIEFRMDDFSSSIGVNVSYEIFAGGRNLGRLQETKAARTEAEYLAAEIELEVASDVRTSVEELRAAQERLVLQRANADFVQRNRDLVERGFTGGIEPVVRLNEAQRDLVEAQANLAFARVRLRSAWHNVRTATAETIIPYADTH